MSVNGILGSRICVILSNLLFVCCVIIIWIWPWALRVTWVTGIHHTIQLIFFFQKKTTTKHLYLTSSKQKVWSFGRRPNLFKSMNEQMNRRLNCLFFHFYDRAFRNSQLFFQFPQQREREKKTKLKLHLEYWIFTYKYLARNRIELAQNSVTIILR